MAIIRLSEAQANRMNRIPKISIPELYFKRQLDDNKIIHAQQAKLIPDRKYVYDFFLPDQNVVIEIQGGTFARGKSAHNSGTGIRRDCWKTNIAQLYGFVVFNFTTDMVMDKTAITFLLSYMTGDKKLIKEFK